MNHVTQSWAAFYEGRNGLGYLEYVKARYAPFIAAIRNVMRPGDLVLELGAGTATITKALIDGKPDGVMFAATDIDPAMLRLARERLCDDDAPVFRMNAARPHLFGTEVIHSHGLLEHFDDDTIRKIIKRQRGARVQVHYVPGLYDTPSYGDERLMSVGEWRDICAPDHIETFNDGLDYLLVFGANNR